MNILINGEVKDTISVNDRGLAYGDGLFETIYIHNGNPILLKEHLQRLQKSCERLHIPFPNPVLLDDEIKQLTKGCSRAVLKIIITRGLGKRGYQPSINMEPTRILMIDTLKESWQRQSKQGIKLKVCETRLSRNSLLAGIKHLNRLEQIMAARELFESDADEGLMLDTEGYVIEGTKTNFFYMIDDVLYTPDLTYSGVEGVMRNKIIQLAKQDNTKILIQKTKLEDLEKADAMFVCNSLVGIWPVILYQEKKYNIPKLVLELQKRHNFLV